MVESLPAVGRRIHCAPDQSLSPSPTSKVALAAGLACPWLFQEVTVQSYSPPAVSAGPS